jgi:CheY-like chemotaxis protein
MIVKEPRPTDRRRFLRREVLATAAIFSSDRLHGVFLVQNLSAGGASLVGDMPLPPGDTVTMLLQFPGKSSVSVSARVVRQVKATKDRRFAVAFVDLSPEDEDAIHEAIVGALEREQARWAATVLVIDADDDAREALERDLRALGHEAVTVATPLEALGWLERPGARICTALVDLAPGPAQALDVLEFLSEHHPDIQRIAMSAELRPFRLDLALRSGRAHKALRKPWNRTRLAETIGPPPEDPAAAPARD